MTTVDFLVLMPVIPALPVLATWWLPWERWIPWLRFSHVLGPFVLYGAFAAWYFGIAWWAVLVFAIGGAALTLFAVIAIRYKPPGTVQNDEP